MTGRKSNIRRVDRPAEPEPVEREEPDGPMGSGDPTWTYNGDPSSSDIAAVRFEIGDTDSTAPLLWDQEIAWAIVDETGLTPDYDATQLTCGPLYSASARSMEVLARSLSRQADRTVGSLAENFSKASVNASKEAVALRTKASAYLGPWSGGESIGDKESWRQDMDLPRPKFRRDQFRNAYAGDVSRGGALPPMSD